MARIVHEVDDRLAAKTRVVGVGLDRAPTAIRLDPLLDAGVVAFDLDGHPAVAWALPGTAWAMLGGVAVVAAFGALGFALGAWS